jgi:ABC-type dipeptide/oligopeptide/nickel transport system permease subunit/ABC-type dipeptide/oligopeptide/nickel transport system permease component
MTPAEYQALAVQYGFNDPIYIQFTKYFLNFFKGSWGEAFSSALGPVTVVLRKTVPKSIETLMIPVLIGLLGIKLGRISVRKKNKVQGYIIRFSTLIFLAIPIFVLITGLQFFGIIVADMTYGKINLYLSGEANIFLTPPPFITGFPFFDSVVSGNWEYAKSILLHGLLPTLALILILLPLIINQTQSYIERDTKDKSLITNPFTAVKLFGFLFIIVILLDLLFNRRGFGFSFFASISSGDLFLINGSFFMLIIFSSFLVFFSNTFPIAYKFLRKIFIKRSENLRKKIQNRIKLLRDKVAPKFHFLKFRKPRLPSKVKPKKESDPNSTTNLKPELKNYIIKTLKNPFTIAGLGLFIFLVSISAFPQFMTPYSLQDITIVSGGTPYAPPSPEHPFGTTAYGFDVLARVLYGTRGALLFGIVVVLIGLAGGSIFGFLAGRFHRYVYYAIVGPMIFFFIIPIAGLLFVLSALFGGNALIIIRGIGVLLIPIFTLSIANAVRREENSLDIAKIIIKYIPLEMVFAILLYQTIGFLGFMDDNTAQLGITLNYGRGHLSLRWASFWPGLFLFLILLSLLLIHEGLKAPTAQYEIINEEAVRQI